MNGGFRPYSGCPPIADVGIYDEHSELSFAAAVSSVADETNEQRLAFDLYGHGTAVAGVACANHDGQGTIGVADGCALYGVDLSYDFFGDYEYPRFTAVSLVVMINDALLENPDIRVVNMSVGFGPNPDAGCDDPVDPIEAWALYRLMVEHDDVLFVTAAGNCAIDVPIVDSPYDLSEQPVQMPAGAAGLLDNVIAVTGVDHDMALAEFANAGPAVTIAAPGGVGPNGDHLWLPVNEDCARTCESAYREMRGTSFAAPFVTGLVALMFQANPALTPNEIKVCLSSTATAPVLANSSGASVAGINIAAAGAAYECAIQLAQDDTASDPVPLQDCLEFTDTIERRTAFLSGTEPVDELPTPIWFCERTIADLNCSAELASRVAALYEDTPDTAEALLTITFCVGDPDKYVVEPFPTATPPPQDQSPSSYGGLETLEDMPQWAEEYWANAPVPVQVTDMAVQGEIAFQHLRAIPVVDGRQLLMVRAVFDGSNAITQIHVISAAPREDTNLYREDELPNYPGWFTFMPASDPIMFDPDPNIRDCGACRPATPADLEQLNAFLQAIQQ